jgi:hypothetical protein
MTLTALALVVLAASCSDSSESGSETSGSIAASTTSGVTTTTTDGTATTGPVQADIDACDLVDVDAANKILGEGAVMDLVGETFGATSVCAWVTPANALLVVTVFEGRQFYDSIATPGSQPIEIGDEATITIEENFGGVGIQFIDGDFVVSLTAAPFGVEDVEGLPDAMTDAAADAANRLP